MIVPNLWLLSDFSSGSGRTGTFIVIDRILNLIEDQKENNRHARLDMGVEPQTDVDLKAQLERDAHVRSAAVPFSPPG